MRDSRAYCECARHTNKRQMSDVWREQHSKLFASLTLSLFTIEYVSLICFCLTYFIVAKIQKGTHTHTFASLCFLIISDTRTHLRILIRL